MDIGKFVRSGKDIVIDLDGIEYLMDDEAAVAFERGDRKVELVQLYDGHHYLIDSDDIRNSLLKKGVIDYLDKRS